jgi:hypothetical protein
MAKIQKLGLEAFEFLKNLVSKAGQDVNNLPDAPSGDFGALKDLPFGMVKKEGIPKTVRVTNPFTMESTIEERIMPDYNVFSPGGFSGAGKPLNPRLFKSIFSQQKDLRELDTDFGIIPKQNNKSILMLRDEIKSLQDYIESKKDAPAFADIIPRLQNEIFDLQNEIKIRTKPEIVD